jgi:SAM-dependent methyltransferase
MSYVRRSSSGALYGTDIDAEAINWCKSNMASVASFSTNAEWPPLAFGDRTFDLVYSISVFTHLPEDMQTAWLEELGRVAKPGSYLLLSTHGKELLPEVTAQDRERFAETGFLYLVGGGTAGLPDFYQNTFHAEDYIHKHWSRFFEIEAIVKGGIANYQDLIVCRNPC